MKKLSLRYFFVLAWACGLALFSISTTVCADDTIKIGVVVGLTGWGADLGTSAKEGMTLALEEINANGGVLGRKLEAVFRDDETNPPKGVVVTRELIYAQNVDVIFGPAFTTVNFAILPVIREAGILHLSFGTGTAIVNLEKNPYTFRMKYSSKVEAEAVVNYAVKAKGHRKVAIFHNSTAYGKAGLAELLPFLKREGVTPVTVQSHNAGDKDMTGQLLNIKKSGATAILAWGFTPDFAVVAKNMQTLGMDIPVYGSAGLTSYFFKDMVGDAGKNFFGVTVKKFSFNNNHPMPADAKAFMDELTKRHGLYRKSALNNSCSWYDAVYVYARAVEAAGSTDKQKVRAAMEQMRHKGISAEIVFTPQDHEAMTAEDMTMAYCTGHTPEGSLRRPDDID